jgi:hypothetical protein
MLRKLSILGTTIATIITLMQGSIVNAEVYKTTKNQVVVTGLTAKQQYDIQTINAKGKLRKRKPVTANTCGEVLIDNGAKMKSVIVGTEKIDPATLPTKNRTRCKAKKANAVQTPKINKATRSVPNTIPLTKPTASPVSQ